MTEPWRITITGAFSYTGKYVTRLLLKRGFSVATLTGHPEQNHPFGDSVAIYPYNFDDPDALTASLKGTSVLINTYWIRFERGEMTYKRAVENTKVLFSSAREAGVRRIVHVSIANPSHESTLPYYSGKAKIEEYLESSGMSYAILRPTVIFGPEDILINNIAYLLRRSPIFPVLGDGSYGIQPIFVEDFAGIILDAALGDDSFVADSVGPEKFEFIELCRIIRNATGSRSIILKVPPLLGYYMSGIVGLFLGDVVLTRDEVKGLMSGLLVSKDEPSGKTKITEWLGKNRDRVGRSYHSELARHFKK